MVRFDGALARTLSIYPLCAGRLVRPEAIGQPWKVSIDTDHLCKFFYPPSYKQIRLTNSGIPVQVIDSDSDQITDAPDRLVQTPLTLSPSINLPALVDTVGTSDIDLMKVTIIRFTKLGRTSIGVSASHCIGERPCLLSERLRVVCAYSPRIFSSLIAS